MKWLSLKGITSSERNGFQKKQWFSLKEIASTKMTEFLLNDWFSTTFFLVWEPTMNRYFAIQNSLLMILTGEKCVLLNSVKEWLHACFWPFSCISTIA